MNKNKRFSKSIIKSLMNTKENNLVKNIINSCCVSLNTTFKDLDGWDRWKNLLSDLDWLWNHFKDERSRAVLESLVIYHIRGGNGDLLWRGKNIHWPAPVIKHGGSADVISSHFRGMDLYLCDLYNLGFPAQLYLPSYRPNEIFELHQYADHNANIFVKSGDVVIDGGGCWGDSAIYFATLAGESGKVYSFEFLPQNLSIMSTNLAINPILSKRINVIQSPLWSEVGKKMTFLCDGPATRLASKIEAEEMSISVESTTIDHLVDIGVIPKVDFIKLDIEGAELEAIKGAARSIRKFRPSLALCVYHCPEHFTQLAQFIHSIHPDYLFSLDHFSKGPWETVLYAFPPQK